jgi:hypothetical protein
VHMLSVGLTFLGAGGFGLAGALVLDYFGLLGARDDTSPGELVLALVIFVIAGVLFGWVAASGEGLSDEAC